MNYFLCALLCNVLCFYLLDGLASSSQFYTYYMKKRHLCENKKYFYTATLLSKNTKIGYLKAREYFQSITDIFFHISGAEPSGMNLESKLESTSKEACIPWGSYLDNHSARYCSTKVNALLAMSVRKVGGRFWIWGVAGKEGVQPFSAFLPLLDVRPRPIRAANTKSSEVKNNS